MFKKPTIGPKDLISVGPSGWPERFDREKANAALRIYVGVVPLEDLVKNFCTEMKVKRSQKVRHEVLWGDVEDYLKRVVGARHSLTATVVLAFWSHAIIFERGSLN